MVFISRWQPNIHHSQIIARAVRVIYDSNFGLQSQGKYQGCLQSRVEIETNGPLRKPNTG